MKKSPIQTKIGSAYRKKTMAEPIYAYVLFINVRFYIFIWDLGKSS